MRVITDTVHNLRYQEKFLMCKNIIMFIHTNKSQMFRGMRDIEEDVIKCEKKGS